MSDPFKIPPFEMPSEERLRAAAERWAASVGPTFIDQWPADLLALSMPTTFLDLPYDMEEILFDKWQTRRDELIPLAVEIDRICGWESLFFRLNSRSPKDAPWPFEIPVSCSGREILKVFAASERILDDLCSFRRSPIKAKLCLREFWPDVHLAREFRCFMKEGEILAVAEYRNRIEGGWAAPSIEQDRDLRAAIDDYLRGTVIPRLHIYTVVIDVCRHRDEWRLLEINPYGLSDPVGAENYAKIEAAIPSIARLPSPSTGSATNG